MKMIRKATLAAFAVALILLAWMPGGRASQGSCVMPTTGTVSGLTLVQDINTCIAALMTSNSGATAPANGTGAVALFGQIWLKTTDNSVNAYDGASWLRLGTMDTSSHLWQPPIGGGYTTNLASATTTDLCSVAPSLVRITGTTTITGFSNTCATGQIKALIFDGILQLTYNATSMKLPFATANITTAAEDRAWAAYLGGGNWEVIAYQRADGTALSASSVFTGAVFFNAPGTFTLASNTNDWNPSGLVALNVLRLTCSSAINVTGLTAPVTDGKTVVIDNVGATNNCTFTSQDALSTAANRFAFDRPLIVRPGRSVAIKYDLAAARWRLWQEITSHPVAGGFKNLRVFNAATAMGDTAPATPNNQMKIAADAITLEDTNGGTVRATSYSCTLDISGSGAGGIDTGAVAAPNWYFIWAIFNPTTNATSCLGSLQSAFGSLTLPSGYTFGARVGANYYVTASAVTGWRRLVQYGRKASYVITASSNTITLPQITNGAAGTYSTTSPTLSSVSVATVVPATAAAISLVYTNQWKGGTASNLLIAPSTSWGGTQNGVIGSTGVIWPMWWGTTGNFSQGIATFNLEGTTIGYIGDAAGASVQALGWEDNL